MRELKLEISKAISLFLFGEYRILLVFWPPYFRGIFLSFFLLLFCSKYPYLSVDRVLEVSADVFHLDFAKLLNVALLLEQPLIPVVEGQDT